MPTKTDDTLELVSTDYYQSWKYCQGSWHDRWINNYKLYNGERVKRGYEGITDTFVPMSFGTVEALVSALFGGKPKFMYMPPQEKQDQKTDILNALIDYYWERDQWSLKVIDTGREMLMLGTSVDYLCWYGDHPVIEHVPLRDFFIDPTCTTIENARYMGRRYLVDIETLESFEVVDVDNPTETPELDEMGEPILDEYGYPQVNIEYGTKKKYKIPKNWQTAESRTNNGTGASVNTSEKTDQQTKNDLYGSTLEEGSSSQVEILEYWTPTRTVSVMNRQFVIEDDENIYLKQAKKRAAEQETDDTHIYKGIMPFLDCRDFVDPSLYYAKSEIDFIADQQELLNDVTNQNIDSVTYTLNQMYTLDPKYADQIEEVENIPGAVYPFEKDALVPIPRGAVPSDAFAERMNLKNEMRETSAINEVVKGVGEDKKTETTATEIKAQLAGAGQRINLKITQLENGYFHRLARILFEMVKLYVTEPMMIRVVGTAGVNWELFDPSEFQGDYEPRIQLDVAVQNKKAEEAEKAKELLGAFLNDPEVNQQELKKLVLARGFDLDPDEVETLLQVDPMAMMNQQMMNGQIPSEMMQPPDDPAQPTFGEMTPDNFNQAAAHGTQLPDPELLASGSVGAPA